MSITMRIVNLIDRLKLNQYFIEREDKAYFSPIHIKINTRSIENFIDHLVKVDGRPYRPNEMEKEVIKELEY